MAEESDDPFARMVAEEDQAQAGLLAFTQRITKHRQYLILGGIPVELADELTANFHAALLGQIHAEREHE